MCLVIDVNTLPSVFDEKSALHPQFRPVLKWIKDEEGKIVMGGTKYREELGRLTRYRTLFVEFGRRRKLVTIPDNKVDAAARKIRDMQPHKDFNDSHIVAIIAVSKCFLVCTKDAKSFRFLKEARLYGKRGQVPKLYTGVHNRNLLVRSNIAPCCLPCDRLPKNEASVIGLS